MADELLDPADAFVHNLRDAPRPEPSNMPERDSPEMGGDVEFRAVLRVERCGMGAQKRCEVASHIDDYPRKGQNRIANHR